MSWVTEYRIPSDTPNNKFPNRWIGRAGPVLWSPRSPENNVRKVTCFQAHVLSKQVFLRIDFSFLCADLHPKNYRLITKLPICKPNKFYLT